MKKYLLILSALICLSSCSHKTKDKVVAQIYYSKLYESEVRSNMPSGLSQEDSLAMANDYIDNWIKEQLILHEAEKKLTLREKNFDKQMTDYRNNLLINAYYDKLAEKSGVYNVTDEELEAFYKTFDKRYTVDKEIVKVNYVKLSKQSSLIPSVKEILFNNERRENEKQELTTLLGDSIEYLLEDSWLFLDDIQNEVAFEFDPESPNKQIEKEVGDYHYLLVILDYKNQRSVNETEEEKAAARMMLINQKKQKYIDEYVNKLFEKAVKEGAIAQ